MKINLISNDIIISAIKTAKLTYDSDLSWCYENIENTEILQIIFSQDECGRNSVDTFLSCINNVWINLYVTEEFSKIMFEKLNNTPYREIILESEIDDFKNYGYK